MKIDGIEGRGASVAARVDWALGGRKGPCPPTWPRPDWAKIAAARKP